MAQKKRSSKTRRGAIGSDPFAEMDDSSSNEAAAVDGSEQEVSLPVEKKARKADAPKQTKPEPTPTPGGPAADAKANVDDAVVEAQAAGSGTVVLPEVLMLANAAEISEQIADALGKGEAFSIDAAALERVDTAGIQLLLAAVSQGRSQGLTVALENASEGVREKARILDLSAQLGLSAESS